MNGGLTKGLLLPVSAAAALASLHAFGATGEVGHGAHVQALRALNDLDVAVGELDAAASLTEHAPDPYKAAAKRALDALVGVQGGQSRGAEGAAPDQEGAIAQLEWLASHAGTAPWKSAVQGAEVNASAAKARLAEAIDADDLQRFQLSASSALEALLVALGRD